MADENKDAPQKVDETPISPTKEGGGRRNSLEKLLQQRPQREELVESKEDDVTLPSTTSLLTRPP